MPPSEAGSLQVHQAGQGGNKPHPGSTLSRAANQTKRQDLIWCLGHLVQFTPLSQPIHVTPSPGGTAPRSGAWRKTGGNPSGMRCLGSPFRLDGTILRPPPPQKPPPSPRRFSGPSQHRSGSSAACPHARLRDPHPHLCRTPPCRALPPAGAAAPAPPAPR